MNWINKYIKIPFVEHGRLEEGCDCWGLIKLIYEKELDVKLPSLLGYRDTKDRLSISSLVEVEKKIKWVEVPEGEEKEFDVVIFRILNVPTHVGLVYKKGSMIHSEKGKGTHLTDFRKDYTWTKRLYGIFRYA